MTVTLTEEDYETFEAACNLALMHLAKFVEKTDITRGIFDDIEALREKVRQECEPCGLPQ